jgi:hypothetical protein
MTAMAVVAAVSACVSMVDVITFEAMPLGPVPGGALVVDVGEFSVTFTAIGLVVRQFDDPFPFTHVLSSEFDAGPITATFEGGTADFVEIENIINGTYTAEVDVIVGTAFDLGGKQIDFAANADTIHHLDGPGIASVVYTENMPGQGFVMDNFAFEVVACAADFNGDGDLNILDFVAFQTAWSTGDPKADCNGDDLFNILDFVCFQQLFVNGC